MENTKHQDDRDGGTQLVDGSHHSDGQVFHGRVAEHPRTKDEGSLAHDKQMLSCSKRFNVKLRHKTTNKPFRQKTRQHNERKKQQSANQSAVEQNGDDGVAHDGLFFEDVVEAQQEG